MSRYRFTVEFDIDETGFQDPGSWEWPELLDIDDDYTTTDWSTWNVVKVDA
jgi:hypothetical protein